jgi:hypothetical protein
LKSASAAASSCAAADPATSKTPAAMFATRAFTGQRINLQRITLESALAIEKAPASRVGNDDTDDARLRRAPYRAAQFPLM